MRKYQVGFTIIELMVTLVVLAIVIAIAVPSFTGIIQRNTSVAIGEEFVTALNFARVEALKRRSSVSLCPSNDDGTACGNNWSDGWIAFVDGATETADSVTVSEVLRVWNDMNRNAEINVSRDNAAVNFIRFAGMGILAKVNGSTNPISATAKQANCSGEAARTITIGISGMVNSKTALCAEAEDEQ